MPDPDDDQRTGDGPVDSDDTTQADAGMAGGSGADEGQAAATPQATEPLADDEELSET